jgi:UDP-N-acetylglucosamine 2-epimerase (non-hydrolysing)
LSKQHTIVCVIGTRPEAIKMAPVIHALHAAAWARCVVIATAQHRDLLDQMLSRLDVTVDHDLDLMTAGQSGVELLSRMLPALDERLAAVRAEAVLAQGDTITVMATAFAAFHREYPFGHVEAGLRTNDLAQPFPEEAYRQMVSRITRWHFAPTAKARANLIAEGISSERIHLTGNTGIDTLLQTVSKLPPLPPLRSRVPQRMILLTAHRRENFGAPLERIFDAVLAIVEHYPDVEVVYPVHPNPQVHSRAYERLGTHPQIRLLQPLDYFQFVEWMRRATLILTDSGGIQEEAPSLGKPVLVLRERTERPEALEAGVSRLVGTRVERIVENVGELLGNSAAYRAMSAGASPYGDGRAAERICEALRADLDHAFPEQPLDQVEFPRWQP